MDEMQLAQAVAAGVAMALGQKGGRYAYGTKAPAVPFNPNQIHGPNGLFGVAGIDNNVLALRIAPEGISSVLKAFPTNETNPLYPYITGFIEDAGDSEPSDRCSTCVSGEIEACLQTAQFGYICRETKTLEPSRLIERVNSGEVDLILVNDVLGVGTDAMAAIRNYDRDTVLKVETVRAMLEVGMLFQNVLAPMYWTGNPANNIGDGYMEFPGLDILIGTNKVDAITGAECQALDSDVKDFGYQHINTVVDGTFAIVRALSYLEQYVYWNAQKQHLLPVEWVWVMRPELWYELTEIWPLAYLTSRNLVIPASNTNFLDATRINDERDRMRQIGNEYLTVNGRTHRVILDSGIFEHNNANDNNLEPGQVASDIYLVPLTYLGNRDATFLQYMDYRAAIPEWNAVGANRLSSTYWTDDGRFRWTVEQRKFCYTISGSVQPRIILKTPQLAGRLNHVMCTPLQHFRDWNPDSDYFYKGGVSIRNWTPYYSDWNLPGQA